MSSRNLEIEIFFDARTNRYAARDTTSKAVVAWGYNVKAVLTNATQRGYKMKKVKQANDQI